MYFLFSRKGLTLKSALILLLWHINIKWIKSSLFLVTVILSQQLNWPVERELILFWTQCGRILKVTFLSISMA